MKASCYFNFSDQGLRIDVTDINSRTQFLELKINTEDLWGLFSSCGAVPCESTYSHLDRVGKKLETKQFIFEVDTSSRDRDRAIELCSKVCPEGWVADNYYGSRSSFFEKEGEFFAKTTIRRWVDE